MIKIKNSKKICALLSDKKIFFLKTVFVNMKRKKSIEAFDVKQKASYIFALCILNNIDTDVFKTKENECIITDYKRVFE